MTLLIKKDESTGTLRRITVIIVDQSDGNTLEPSQTNFNIEVSKAGGAQAAGTGNFVEVGEGEYYYEFGTTEVNTFGKLTARFAKTGMREFKGEAQVVGFNPYQTIPTQSEINDMKGTGFVKANHSLVKTQSNINALNDPTPSEINAVIETAHGAGSYSGTSSTVINSIVNAHHDQTQSLINNLDGDIQTLNNVSITQIQSIINNHQTDINNTIEALNDPTPSEINAVIETAHGAGSYAGTSSTVINSIVNAQGLEVQSLINALNDPTPSEINAVITTAHGAGSYVGGGGQTTYNAVIANQSILNQNQSLINNLDVDIAALNDPTPSEINAVITTAHGAGSYVGAGASQTVINKLDQIQTDVNEIQTDVNNLNDPTSSEINAVITTAHGAGSYVGAGGNTVVNLLNDIQTDTNTAIPNLINGLNDPTPSEINAVIETAHGAGSYSGTSSTVINSIVNAQGLEVQSLINALNDLNTSEVQSIVNAEGNEVQSLINALNDISTSEVQSIVNAQGLEIQSLINAMDVKIVRIEGRGGQYLVGKYSYNSSDINTKIEYWQYSSQTDMNNHQTVNNINKWQLDATLTGQLTDLIKVGDHA